MVGLALTNLSAHNSVCLPFLLVLIYCRNWHVVGLAFFTMFLPEAVFQHPLLLCRVLTFCRNWYVVGLALTYFFVYVVRQGVTSWFVFYLLQVRMQQHECNSSRVQDVMLLEVLCSCARSRLCAAHQGRNQLFISPLHGLCCPL